MNIIIARNSLPLRWRGRFYQITDCGIKEDILFANTIPVDVELMAELENHLLLNRKLIVYLHHGYKILIESSAGV